MGWFGCRSRVLTLDGARYTITERKGGVGYVRTHIPPLVARADPNIRSPF